MTKEKREQNQEKWKTAIVQRFPGAKEASLPAVFIDIEYVEEEDENLNNQLKTLQQTVSEMGRFDCKDITAVMADNDRLKAENDQLKTDKKQLEEREDKLRKELEAERSKLQVKEQELIKREEKLKLRERNAKRLNRTGRPRKSTTKSDPVSSETSPTSEEDLEKVFQLDFSLDSRVTPFAHPIH